MKKYFLSLQYTHLLKVSLFFLLTMASFVLFFAKPPIVEAVAKCIPVRIKYQQDLASISKQTYPSLEVCIDSQPCLDNENTCQYSACGNGAGKGACGGGLFCCRPTTSLPTCSGEIGLFIIAPYPDNSSPFCIKTVPGIADPLTAYKCNTGYGNKNGGCFPTACVKNGENVGDIGLCCSGYGVKNGGDGIICKPSPTTCIANGAATTDAYKCCSDTAAYVGSQLTCKASTPTCIANGTATTGGDKCCSGSAAYVGSQLTCKASCIANGAATTGGDKCCSGSAAYVGSQLTCKPSTTVCIENGNVTTAEAKCCSGVALSNGDQLICKPPVCIKDGNVTSAEAKCCSGVALSNGDQLICKPSDGTTPVCIKNGEFTKIEKLCCSGSSTVSGEGFICKPIGTTPVCGPGTKYCSTTGACIANSAVCPPTGGQCIPAGQSCEVSGKTCCTNSACQGVTGNRICQTLTNTCPNGQTCGGNSGQGFIGFRCNNLSNGQCLQNPQYFTSFQAAKEYAGTCGQADEVCTIDHNLCGQFSIDGSGCGKVDKPPGATPTPGVTPTPIGPVCLNIAMSKINPAVGDSVSFTCGQVQGAARYQFRVKLPSGSFQLLDALGGNYPNVSESFIISGQGAHFAQCRICTGVEESTCLPYSSI